MGRGKEAVYIDLIKLRLYHPNVNDIAIDCRAHWYGSIGTQPVKMVATLFKGGAMIYGSYTYTNPTATSSATLDSFADPVNTYFHNPPGGPNPKRIAVFTYNLTSKIGRFVTTWPAPIPSTSSVSPSVTAANPFPAQFLSAMAVPNLSLASQTCFINPKSLMPNVSDKDLAKTDHLVSMPFLIGKSEVTNEEYCVFLNAVAKQSDPRGLYSASMSSALNGGILRTGNAGAYAYTVKSGMENYPVLYVSWFDAARYVNWLSNDSPTGLQDKTTTEDGAYALNGAVSGVSIVRNAINPNTKLKPTRWLLNESEWFTSAYLKSSDSTSVSFWNYPTQSDTSPDLKLTNPKNLANYGNIFDGPTEAGFFSDSPSAFGTFDQGGNVREWTESVDATKYRIIRGGSWADSADAMKASESDVSDPALEDDKTGFRIGGAP